MTQLFTQGLHLDRADFGATRFYAAFLRFVFHAFGVARDPDLLIRRSPEFTYFNRIDRLAAWKGSLLGGHKPPPDNLQAGAA